MRPDKENIRKGARDYNNIFSMNCFEENKKYLEGLPAPAWTGYRDTFGDWGPHGNGTESMVFKYEPWKAYKTIEDAIEDWCANIRYQAYSHGHEWKPEDLVSQLLTTESYTPEGATDGVRAGLHYDWQEQIMKLYEKYDLGRYDKENAMINMTTANLDKHIADAYAYAHNNCKYGPTDTHYPPGEPASPGEKGAIDCCGLVFRAFYTMGRLPSALNINQIIALCEGAGMKKSTDPSDIWRHHCVVCMQAKHLKGSQHVSHVYYSLGGTDINSICKYDLGSNERIAADQPFAGVAINEWTDKYNFFCLFYVDEKRENVPAFESETEYMGTVLKNAGLYGGPGTAWKKLGTAKQGKDIILRGIVTNEAGHQWRAVRYGNTEGYIFGAAVTPKNYAEHDAFVRETDGTLSVRVGAGGGCRKIADLKEGSKVRVIGRAKAADGKVWYNVKTKKLYGFVSGDYLADK